MLTYDGFNKCYHDLLRLTMDEPEHVCRPGSSRPTGRGGGQEIRERLAQGFVLRDPRSRLSFAPGRDLSIAYAIAELVWYLTANDSTEWIAYYAPFWRNISDDGTTANSAYGARIFRQWHPRVHGGDVATIQSQWERVREELRRDPETRRAVLQIRSAADGWLADKDVPCTLSLQFFLRDGKLHLVTTMRSSDIILGLPYDVIAFTVFQELMALELGVELGTYTHVSNSLHVYERDFERVRKIIDEDVAACAVERPMPRMTSMPSLESLTLAEAALRRAQSGQEIGRVIDAMQARQSIFDPESCQYWTDWIRVLASHRAGRLSFSTFQRELLESTEWSGYSAFKR